MESRSSPKRVKGKKAVRWEDSGVARLLKPSNRRPREQESGGVAGGSAKRRRVIQKAGRGTGPKTMLDDDYMEFNSDEDSLALSSTVKGKAPEETKPSGSQSHRGKPVDAGKGSSGPSYVHLI